MNKLNIKGVSAIIAVILFLLITASSYFILQNWYIDFSQNVESNYKTQTKNEMFRTEILGLEGDILYFKNVLGENISVKDVKIAGKNCNISQNLSVGFDSINLTSCLDNITARIGEVVVITDYGVFSKTYHLESFGLSQPGIDSGESSGGETSIVEYLNLGNGNDTVLLLISDGTYDSQEFKNIADGYSFKSLGLSSAYFDGSGDYLIVSSNTDDFNLGTGDFTIDFWFNSGIAITDYRTVIASTSGNNFELYFQSSQLKFFVDGSHYGGFTLSDTSANKWHHYSIVRNGNNIHFFQDGSLLGTSTGYSSASVGNSVNYQVGNYAGSSYLNGKLDSLRVIKGKALWTSNFNLSDLNYTVDSNTKLLLKFDEGEGVTTFTDLSPSVHTITRTGNVVEKQNIVVSGDVKHVSFNEAKIGTGAAYFDGAGDYLTVSDSNDWVIGTGDFTAEFWIKSGVNHDYHEGILGQTNWACIPTWAPHAWSFGYDNTNHLILSIQDGSQIISTTTFNDNVWHHVAGVRDGSYIRLYVDGKEEGTAINIGSTSIRDISYALHIATAGYCPTNAGTQFSGGYLDEIRVSKGIARYTSEFSPSTEPFVNDSYTKLLLHFDSIGSTIFTDSETTPKTVTRYGDTNQKGIPFNSDLAAYFDGAGDYLSIPDSPDWNLGSDDFTIDFWIKKTNSDLQEFLTQWLASGGLERSLEIRGSNIMGIYLGIGPNAGDMVSFTGTKIINDNLWHHIAIIRDGTSLNLYVDGKLDVSTTISQSVSDSSQTLKVGRYSVGDSSFDLNGYLDEIRISKGIARWTSNFNPPTEPYTSDSYTKLLLHFDGENGWTNFTDSSGQNHIVTRNGDVKTERIYPINYSAIYFDGTGDYLSLTDSSDWNLGIGNFTIDGWFNIAGTATSGWHTLISGYSGSERNFLIQVDDSTKKLRAFFTPTSTNWDYTIASSNSVIYNTWNHFALVRNRNNFNLYLNGILEGTTTFSGSIFDSTENLQLGTNSLLLNGYLDNIRITKGKALWTSNFVPPNSSSTLIQMTYDWEVESWSDCDGTCLSGSQTRTVICKNSIGDVKDDIYCSETKPATSQSCSAESMILTGDVNGGIGTIGTFKDCRDDSVYNWKKQVDSKIWMAEGLAYNYGTDGVDSVSSNWNNERYYYELSVIAGLCPQGWHITTKSEWISFVNILFSRSISVFYGDDLWTTSNTGACSTWNSFDEKVNGYYNNGWYYPSTSFCYHNVANNYIVNDLNVFKGSLMWTSGTDPNRAYISSTVSGNAYDWGEIRCIKDY